jgi:hypothetical protein
MVATPGFSEILLLLLSVGGTSNDVVALIDAPAYFKSREVEISLDKMLELAQKTGEGKSQIMQLLAIRRLGSNFPDDKAKIIQILAPVAKGEKAQDRLGFSKEYAIRSLRQLGSNMALPAAKGERNLTRDLLGWFPIAPTVVGAIYVAPASTADPKAETQIRALLGKIIPDKERAEFFDFADKVGNVRIDGFGFGVLAVENPPEKWRTYLHLKGKADPKLIAAVIAGLIPNGQLQEEKDAKGMPVRIVTAPNVPPAFAFVGDTDLLMAGYGRTESDHLELLRQMLKVRAEGKGSVLAGHLADALKRVSPKAFALVVGALSEEARRDFGRGLSVPLPVPNHIHLEATRSDQAIGLSLACTYETEDRAKEFVDGLAKVNKQAIGALEKIPADKLPAETNKLLQTTLKSFRIDLNGKTATLHSQVSAELLKKLPELLIRTITLEPGPPPIRKIEKDGSQARLWLTSPPMAIPCLHDTRHAV